VVRGKESFEVPEDVINAENSGTTIRIISSMSALVRKGYTILTGDESLRKRPMMPLLSALNQLGVECFSTSNNGTPPLVVKGGGIRGGIVNIEGNISSQFISSLIISSIYARSQVVLKVKGKQVSRPYIEATIETMKKFGVKIKRNVDYSEYVIPKSRYKGTFFNIPADFSNAALMISAGVLCGKKITIEGLNFEYPQGDKQILDIIKKMGVDVKVDKEKGEVTVLGSTELKGIDCDLSNTPDLLPAIAILSLKVTSPLKIYGISHARLKETDRVSIISSQLKKLGVPVSEMQNEIILSPIRKIKNAKLDSHNDHRLFMAFTIASLLTEKSVVTGAESVDVSYPVFLNDLKCLGANLNTIE
jgi:3-phosphoshikimate 1-carboxyvinyltransferase